MTTSKEEYVKKILEDRNNKPVPVSNKKIVVNKTKIFMGKLSTWIMIALIPFIIVGFVIFNLFVNFQKNFGDLSILKNEEFKDFINTNTDINTEISLISKIYDNIPLVVLVFVVLLILVIGLLTIIHILRNGDDGEED